MLQKWKIKQLTEGKTSQNRARLLFHGLIRLWLRNSGYALKQSRHGRLTSSHKMSQTLTQFCLCLLRRCV